MIKHRLDRDNEVPLVFNGVLIAAVSSEHDEKRVDSRRWTELTLYKTVTGRYVIEIVGRSRAKGEFDRHTVRVVDTPNDVRLALHRKGEHGPYLTYLALDLLDEAVSSDAGFDLEEHI